MAKGELEQRVSLRLMLLLLEEGQGILDRLVLAVIATSSGSTVKKILDGASFVARLIVVIAWRQLLQEHRGRLALLR